MTVQIVTLMALVALAAPAFGQTTFGGHEAAAALAQSTQLQGSYEPDLSPGDCEARYRSARARNEMLPSQRRAALALCRAAASAQRWHEELARTGE